MNWEIKNNIPFFKICVKKNDFFFLKNYKSHKKMPLKKISFIYLYFLKYEQNET